MLRWLLIFVLALIPLGGFMYWRLHEFTAPVENIYVPLKVAMPKTDIDLDGAQQHLAQALQFKTIADVDGSPRDPAAFLSFETWLTSTYPAIASAATVERIADYSLLYTWTGSDPKAAPILIIGHLDVASVEGGGEFSGVLRNGAVWGRGAQIGKGPLISILEAANALAVSGFKPRRTVILAFGHDGDVRGEAGAAQIAKVLKARGVKAWFGVDEGPPVAANNALTNRPSVLLALTEKRELNLIVRSESPPGAASIRRQQAVTNVAQALVALDAMPNSASLTDEPTADMLRALALEMPASRAFVIANSWLFEPLILFQLRNAPGAEDLIATTVSPTVVEGGANQTLNPSEARAMINVRLHPRETPEQFIERARMIVSAFPGVTLEWEEEPGPPIPMSSDKSAAFRLVATLASKSAGNVTVAPCLYIGSTDARHYTGVAQDLYRHTPALWNDDDVRNVMGPREHLSRDNLARMIGFYKSIIVEAAG